jgi:hypothetical protein
VHATDGRWSWHTSGEPLAFEQPNRYTARRVRDRFDRSLLVTDLRSQRIRVDELDFYGPALRVHQLVNHPIRQETADQVRARFGW